MTNDDALQALKKNSFYAAIGTALGAVIVLAAIVFSVIRLQAADRAVAEKKKELGTANKELKGTKENLAEAQGDLGKANSELSSKKAELKEASEDLAKKKHELEQVESWGDLFRLCAVCGDIVLTRTDKELNAAYERLQKVGERINELAAALNDDRRKEALAIITGITGLKPALSKWMQEKGWKTSQFPDEVLTLCRQARHLFEKAPASVSRFSEELARLLYEQAIERAVRLSGADAESWDEERTQADRDIFWRLYYSELIFVENPTFAKGMYQIGQEMRKAKGKRPNSLAQGLEVLAKGYEKDFKRRPRLLPRTGE